MQTTLLGNTGVRVSRLCAGTMAFGSSADEAMSAKIFHRCREAGINFFDTADVYGGGRSEELLGDLINDCRDEVVIATKAYFPTGSGPNDQGSSPYHLVRAVEASLRRLRTDRIDVFYLHRFDARTPLIETLRCVEDLRRQGKILYPAVSNFAAWQIARAIGHAERWGWAPVCCVQPMYNLVKRQVEVEILPLAAAENLAVCPYSPLGGGLLSGRYGRARRPEAGRLIDNPMYRSRYGAPSYFETAEAFVDLADEVGVHPVSLAVAWVAAHPAVTAPIVGARTVEQLEPALRALDIAMDEELRDRVSALSQAPPPATDRNEEGSTDSYDRVLRR